MSFEPREYLRHIAAEAQYLETMSLGLSHEQFLEDSTLQRAFVRSFEIIGEATKKIPTIMREQHPEVEWRAMAGIMSQRMRWSPCSCRTATMTFGSALCTSERHRCGITTRATHPAVFCPLTSGRSPEIQRRSCRYNDRYGHTPGR